MPCTTRQTTERNAVFTQLLPCTFSHESAQVLRTHTVRVVTQQQRKSRIMFIPLCCQARYGLLASRFHTSQLVHIHQLAVQAYLSVKISTPTPPTSEESIWMGAPGDKRYSRALTYGTQRDQGAPKAKHSNPPPPKPRQTTEVELVPIGQIRYISLSFVCSLTTHDTVAQEPAEDSQKTQPLLTMTKRWSSCTSVFSNTLPLVLGRRKTVIKPPPR